MREIHLRAMTPALVLILLTLAAYGGSVSGEPQGAASADSVAAPKTTAAPDSISTRVPSRNAPPAVRYDQYPSAGDMAPPAATLSNPLAADPAATQTGEVLFAAMNCDGCHGGGAVGFVGPSLVDGRWRYGGDDGAVFHSIFYGRPRGMPAYGGLLNDTTVWQLINYVRSQPVPDVVPTVAWPQDASNL